MVKITEKIGVTQSGSGTSAVQTADPLDELMKVRDSKDTLLERFRLTLVGPPKEGKTHCALTASEFFPEESAFPLTEMVDLQDMFWCLLDNGGFDGLAERRLSVPHIDLSNVPPELIIVAIRKFTDTARERILAGVTKTVVYDSLTALDKLLLTRLMKDYEKWGLYNALLAEHLKIFTAAKSLACNVILICHGKYVTPAEDAAGQGRQMAAGVTPGTIEMNLSGQIADFYRQSMSLIMPVSDKGRGADRSFWIHPHGAKGFAGYTRFAGLEKEEPAHLGKLFAKIRGNQPAK